MLAGLAIGRDARGLRIGGNGEASAVGKAKRADPLRIASRILSVPRFPAGSQHCAVLLVSFGLFMVVRLTLDYEQLRTGLQACLDCMTWHRGRD